MHSDLPWEFIEITIIQKHQIIFLECAQLNISIMLVLFALLLYLLLKSNQKSFFFEILQLSEPLLQGSMVCHTCECHYAQTRHDVLHRNYGFYSIEKPKRRLSCQFFACHPISPYYCGYVQVPITSLQIAYLVQCVAYLVGCFCMDNLLHDCSSYIMSSQH